MITRHMDYNKKHNFPILNDHPVSIYFQPTNGIIYYLRRQTLKKLGFPRLLDNQKKEFKWKKMNFQTQLPKSQPKVSYIVCSTTGSIKQFRMHIVQLFQCKDPQQYLLCHLLQMESKHPQTNKIEKPIFQLARTQWLQIIQNNQTSVQQNNKNIHSHQEDSTKLEKEDITVKKLCKQDVLIKNIRNKRQELYNLMNRLTQFQDYSEPFQIKYPLSDNEIFIYQKQNILNQLPQINDQDNKNIQLYEKIRKDAQILLREDDLIIQKGLHMMKLTEYI